MATDTQPKKPGRPKKEGPALKRLEIRIPEEVYTQLQWLMKTTGMKKTDIMEAMIRNLYAAYQSQEGA